MNASQPVIFTDGEIAYLAAQRLGRLATIGPDGGPQLNPVSCYYNPATQTIDVGGHDMARSRKYRNARADPRIAVVADDMSDTGIRCLEIRGVAETIDEPDDSAARVPGAIIRIHPRRIVSWGIDPPDRARGARTVPLGDADTGYRP
jgi:pyridoxamine 5'-phosphate oxidase family protein